MKSLVVSMESVKHGMLTSMIKKSCGVVRLSDKSSAYINPTDQCTVSINASGTVTFASGGCQPLVTPSDPHPQVVVVLSRRNPDWVYVWCFASDFAKAKSDWRWLRQQEELWTARCLAALEKERQEKEAAQSAREKVLKNLNSLGMFRIAEGHKFDQEAQMRPSRKFTVSNVTLARLLVELNNGSTKFIREKRHGVNDTVFQWFERQYQEQWIRVEMSDRDIEDLTRALFHGHDVTEIINKIHASGSPMAMVA